MTTLLDIIHAVLENQLPYNHGIQFCSTSALLQSIGCADLPVIIGQQHIKNITASFDDENSQHDISPELLAKVPEALEHPMFVFDSPARSDSVVAVLDLYDNKNQALFVCIHVNGFLRTGRNEQTVNFITSIYGKRNDGTQAQFSRAAKENRLLYFDSKLIDNMFKRTGFKIKYNFLNNFDKKVIKLSSNVKNTAEDAEKYNKKYRH